MSMKETLGSVYYGLKNVVKKPATFMYPDKPMPVDKRSRGMLSLDMDNCIGCELCYKICPADAIKMTKINMHFPRNPRDEAPAVDFNKCIFCGLCSEICPPQVLHHTHKFDISTEDRFDLLYSPFRLKEVYLKEVAEKTDEYDFHSKPNKETETVAKTGDTPSGNKQETPK